MSDVVDAAVNLNELKGWGGWSLFFLALIWYIRGAPDRKRASTEGDSALRESYEKHFAQMTARIDKVEDEHEKDRTAWMVERRALRDEYEADRQRWNAEREQWRKERTELLDQVAGLERKLKSYGSSADHLRESENAPTTGKRLLIVNAEDQQ